MDRRSLITATFTLALAGSASSAAAQADVYLDESSTFYLAHGQRMQSEGSRRWTTYQVEARGRAFRADAPFSRDATLRWELRQGERRLAGTTCRSHFSGYGARGGGAPPHMLSAGRCADRDSNVTETGELTVVWFYVDGTTDAQTELARHTIVVRELPVVDRGLPPTPTAPHVIIDRHGEALTSFLIEDPFTDGVGTDGYFERLSHGGGDVSNLYLTFNASPEDDENLGSTTLRCRLDGQPVELADSRVPRVESLDAHDNAWLAVPGATTIAESAREHIVRFHRYAAFLPLTLDIPGGRVASGRTPLRQGAWECDLRSAEAVTLRTFRFAVGADGRVLPHPEETEGGLRLGPGIHFVETVVPAEHPLDFRTDPGALARALHGRGFRSAAARALTIPPAAEPFPVAARADGRGGGSSGSSGGGRPGRRR